MSFLKYVEDADKDLQEIIDKKLHEKIYTDNTKTRLLAIYIQYRQIRCTWWLVFATWALAIATIILVIVVK